MSPKNIEYLHGHYRLRPEQKVHLLPIWGQPKVIPNVNRQDLRHRKGLPLEKVIAVFGGQLVAGRGIEDLLEVAALAGQRDPRLFFLVIGSGPLEAAVKKYMENKGENLQWIPRIPREDYLQLLSACDIGLVCTIRGVDVPSFPSKTIDFFQVSLPIVASVEAATDYSEFVVQEGVGLASEAGVAEAFLGNLQKLANDLRLREAMGKRGRHCLEDVMNVDRIASLIVSASKAYKLGSKS
jgi:glycosyltransferase involved in cell wall biosynthesis